MAAWKLEKMGVRRCKNDGQWMGNALLNCDQARIAHRSSSGEMNRVFNVALTSLEEPLHPSTKENRTECKPLVEHLAFEKVLTFL